jgi:hypothetical protein
VESWVYNDPAWLAGLTFVYQVRLDPNTGPSLDEVHRFTTFGWAGFSPFVEQEIVGVPGIDATLDGSGNTVGFNFASPLLFIEGMNSARLIVRSSAPAWTTGIGAVIDGQSSNVDVLVPAAAVPDGGTTAMLLAFSFLGVAARRKMRG